MIELRDLECVLAIAEHKGINKAADQLATSQSALSKRLQNLEDRIGFSLFHREPRGVKLSDAGQVFLDEGRKLLCHGHDFHRLMQQYKSGLYGTLSVGIKPGLDHVFLIDALTTFAHETPHVQLKITIDSTPALTQMVESGKLDFAFGVLGYIDNHENELLNSDTINFEHLFLLPVSIIVRKGHPWLQDKNLEDLYNYPMISSEAPHKITNIFRKGFLKKKNDFSPPQIAIHDSGVTQEVLKKTDMWSIVYTPINSRDNFSDFELVTNDAFLKPLNIGIIKRNSWTTSPIAEKFIALAVASVKLLAS